jgi:putative glycosyltransferase (TIGR04348 family)
MPRPRVLIVSPATAAQHNGNAHTAARWQRLLADVAEVDVVLQWRGEPADAMIALHARRSAASIAGWHRAHPQRPLAVVLTGTDLYLDLPNHDADAEHAVQCASRLVVLQPQALRMLAAPLQAKARVILQSADGMPAMGRRCDFVAVGHLRDVKDPLTLMAAVRLLPPDAGLRIVHVGEALEPALADAARRTMAACPRYAWLGALAPQAAREWIASARALVHTSRLEGGANVVIEAVRSGVPVLASRMDGNIGLLGHDYAGYFPVGDAAALAALMQRFVADARFAQQLRAQCTGLHDAFAPAAERAALHRLLADLLAR